MWQTLAVFLLLSELAFAAEVCVTLDVSAWTQDQRNARQAIAHALANDVGGQNIIPHSPSGAQVTEAGNTQICFTDPIFDVPTVITAQAMLDRYAIEEAARQAAATAEATRQAAFESEVTTNDLCSSELSALDAKIDTAIDAASNLTQLKTVLKAGLKKVVRCVRARAR